MGLITLNKVLISDKIDSVCAKTFAKNGVEVVYKPGMKKEELIKIIPEFNGLIVRSSTKVTADVIAAATNLKIIGRAGTGVDNIDIPAASDAGIVVMNTPGGNTLSAAEHTCALIMALCRNLANRHTELMNGQWNRINGIELNGKVLGIIGLGQIGMVVAKRMAAFGMRVVGYDPITPPEVAAKNGIEFLQLDEMWPVCDFLTVHVPLLPSTRHLINEKVLSTCKKGVRIVNCARGGIIDEEALLDALNSGDVACAALDVFEQEPPSCESALLQHPNLIATPHLGASTGEAQVRVAKEIAEQFAALRDGKSSYGCINAPLIRAALSQPTLAKLARLVGMALAPFASNSSVISVQSTDTAFVPSAVLAGFLNAKGITSANLISIKQVAAANNVSFEVKEGGNASEITVSAGDVKLTGRVDGETCYLVKLNNTSTFIPLTGSLTVVKADAIVSILPDIANRACAVFFAGQYAFIQAREQEELEKAIESCPTPCLAKLVMA